MVSRKKKVASSVLVLRSCDGPEYALVVGVTRDMQRKGGVVERAQAVIDGVRDSHVARHCDCEYTVDDVYEALEDAGFVIFQNTIREGPMWDGNATEQSFGDYLTQVDDVLASGGHATSTQDELEEISEDHGAGRSVVEAVRGLLVLRQKEKT